MPKFRYNFYMLPLGTPIPNNIHAVSVSMPLWSDIIGYEEGVDEIVNKL